MCVAFRPAALAGSRVLRFDWTTKGVAMSTRITRHAPQGSRRFQRLLLAAASVGLLMAARVGLARRPGGLNVPTVLTNPAQDAQTSARVVPTQRANGSGDPYEGRGY